ncbi:hypothetical protein GCM10010984_14490 [Chishuiella changwenlii]|uniref:Uncharacterized protein n=2 Tax=Chishuiella changwenlii TaxID=1434701 RepID=A0ABQ1TM57_9FLAO|nr:hypothetical protein GCM10010984_14490 [Chishuiella changwenlii]
MNLKIINLNMKINFFLILGTVFYLNANGQIVHDKVVFYETYNKSNDIDKIDLRNLNYKAGEPVFIVINVESSVPNEDFLAQREQEELKSNFGIKTDFINYTADIKFYNRFKTVLKFSYEDSPKQVIYWSGKMDDKPIVYDGLLKSSEYFSPYLKQNKYSSYIESFNKRKDILITDFVDNPTDKSIQISNRLVNKMLLQSLYNMKEESNFFEINFKNIKRVTYTSNFDIDNDKLKEVTFDKDGKPLRIVFEDLKDKNYYYQSSLVYEDNILRKIVSESTNDYHTEVPVFYQDDKLFTYDQYSIKQYRLGENNFLLSEDYYYDDEKFYFLVNQVKVNNNVLRFIENDHMNDRTYSFKSLKDYFPIKIKIREDIDEEIKRVNDKLYKETSSSYEIEYHFTNNNLIDKIVYIEKANPKQKRIINYIYEYYK